MRYRCFFHCCRQAARDEEGAVLVEFAIALPLLLLIMAAFADFGTILHQRLRLEEAVSAASTYAVMSFERLEETGPADFAAELANLLAATGIRPPVTFEVNVNDSVGLRMTDGTSTPLVLGGAPESCYCPQRNGAGFSFGPELSCNAACADGSRAGRYIVIEAARDWSPLFASYGLAEGGVIRASAIVPILE